MAIVDQVYNDIIRKIDSIGAWEIDKSVRTRWADGTSAFTKSLLNVQMKFNNALEIPILTSKRVPLKDPINELLWIWQEKSNDVNVLRDKYNCKVWNEWERPDGTIGKAYGWQLANKKRRVKFTAMLGQMYLNGEISKLNLEFDPDNRITTEQDILLPNWANLDQVDYLIYMLKTNPHSRRIKTTLWSVEDLDDMALEPCVYETHWQLWKNKLHLTVNVRSNDMGLGNPYNIYQYAMLHRMIAQVTDHQVGEICFNIDNAHIYDRHMSSLISQTYRPTYAAPTVWINPNITSFYDFKISDIKVNYYQHEKAIKLEVAI